MTTKRAKLEQRIHTSFTRLVQENLVGSGFTPEGAAKTTLPAESDRIASEVNLQRQLVLNQIAEREAERRGNEGLGIKKLIEQLPKDFNPVQLKDIAVRACRQAARRLDAEGGRARSGKVW